MTLSGVEFAFLDATASLGHYIEVYEAGEAVKGFYEYVESLSRQPWDTQHPFVGGNTQIKVLRQLVSEKALSSLAAASAD